MEEKKAFCTNKNPVIFSLVFRHRGEQVKVMKLSIRSLSSEVVVECMEGTSRHIDMIYTVSPVAVHGYQHMFKSTSGVLYKQAVFANFGISMGCPLSPWLVRAGAA
jgi:hypothetical protein